MREMIVCTHKLLVRRSPEFAFNLCENCLEILKFQYLSVSDMMKLAKISLSLTTLWISFCSCISQIITFIWSHYCFQSLSGFIFNIWPYIISTKNLWILSYDNRLKLILKPILLASSVIARSNSSLPLSSSLVPPPCLWFAKWSPSNTIATPSP